MATEAAYTIISLDEAKRAVRWVGTDTTREQELADLCDAITLAFERETSREFVPRILQAGPDTALIDEFHDLSAPQGFLQLRVFPVYSIAKVFMGQGSDEELDPDLYVFGDESGEIKLIGSTVTSLAPASVLSLGHRGSVSGWPTDFPEDAWRFGRRFFPPEVGGARVQYVGGYRNQADGPWPGPTGMDLVPADLKLLASEVIAKAWRSRERKSEGMIQEVAQGFSIATKFDQSFLNSVGAALGQKERLKRFRNRSRTARR